MNIYRYIDIKGYDSDATIYPEIIYIFSKLCESKNTDVAVLKDILTNFPQDRYILEMFKIPEAATDKEHDKARKSFLLLYFANYVYEKPPDKFFADFMYALNGMLDKCGYAKLYPANPFDWLILNCVRSVDYNEQEDGQDDGLNPIELFNDVLSLLIDDSEMRM